jgi:hypothetical protein
MALYRVGDKPMKTPIRSVGFLLVGATVLGSCGASLPIMRLQYSTEERFKEFVKGIALHVKCELANAVAREYSPYDPKRKALFKWAARVALTIRALDKGDFNPGVSVFNTAATRTLAVGGAFETNGTREMTMTYYLPFDELLQGRKVPVERRELPNCDIITSETGISDVIAGNLGIHETLKAAFETWDAGLTLSERIKEGPFDTITHHVTFQVIAGGSATPTWKLVNVTVNNTSPFLSATRTTTDELLITVGPKALGDRKELDTSFGIERLRSVINRP